MTRLRLLVAVGILEPPACARQEPAGGREKEPVRPRHGRTARSSPEDGEFVPKHDDFQVFKFVRPNTQGKELKKPPKHHVIKREEHQAPASPSNRPIPRLPLLRASDGPVSNHGRNLFMHPSGIGATGRSKAVLDPSVRSANLGGLH